ncbi:hypothetical protein MMC26_003594 [Xylographa opegraphella]|nr:hypothetical protein [Xylographa opegraphella]
MPMTWTDKARAEVRVLSSPFPSLSPSPSVYLTILTITFSILVLTPVQLLAHILRIHPIKLDYESLAEAMGPECTKKAVQSQIQRIKNAGNTTTTVDDEHEANAEAQGLVAPKQRTRSTPIVSAMKGARRDAKRKSKAADDEAEETDEEEGMPMGKKRKVRFEDEDEELVVETAEAA